MKTYHFSVAVPYSECERFYTAGANSVIIVADSGERVQLPTRNLRPHVDRQGLNGRFRLIVDDANKVKSFERVR